MYWTKQFGKKIMRSDIDLLASKLIAIRDRDGNPMEAEMQHFGNASAFICRGIPGHTFNIVKGLTQEDMIYIDDIFNFYLDRNIPIRFELEPECASAEIFACLTEKGCYQSGFHTVLYGNAKDCINHDHPEDITVRSLEKSEFRLFAEIYVKAFGMPDFTSKEVACNNAILHEDKHWQFFIASYQGEPAGIAVLYLKDDVGTLAASATLPYMRKRGLHRAMIDKRIHAALKKNIHLITGQASFGSISQYNMEKAGLQVAYTKAIWTAS
ncbi:GNAT family N-acetyltransferase [Virgibacillus halophilus]|uniref:GNAT family N-acetyltransferase n=1 Tax=Tigheibacillus halophilus TaxID=361280 RepID=A0ABU5C4Y3_9BACI|nr:GNAT family N-acetyltransferase [Virgibacillus halophilus]